SRRRVFQEQCHGLSRQGKPCLCARRACASLQAPSFTLLELIVVILIITILAGLIAPRVLDTSLRRAEAEAGDVSRLLSAAAQKDALTPRTLAIAWDGQTRRLELLHQQY